jgi:hypothetical protein
MNKPAIRCFYAIEPSCIECPWKNSCQIYKEYYAHIKEITEVLQLTNDEELDP